MLDEKKSTLHASRHPSLLLLRMALTAAERESPSCPARSQTGVDEQLALEFIEKVQKDHKRSNLFVNMKEMAGIDA